VEKDIRLPPQKLLNSNKFLKGKKMTMIFFDDPDISSLLNLFLPGERETRKKRDGLGVSGYELNTSFDQDGKYFLLSSILSFHT